MADIIRYSPIEHQVEKLKSQGLIISDEDYVKALLSQCGYSNLIKSYRDPYIFSTAMGLKYREGITFEQVASLYFFDRSLRNAVMSSMLDLEEHVKTVAAEVVAKNIGTDHNVYLNKRNYRNKRVRNQHFTLDAILERLKNATQSGSDPIHHCMVTRNCVPPWILFNGVYFSTIVNLIDQFKIPLQEQVASSLYNASELNLNSQQLRFLMMDTLFIALEYRNLAAHGGRVYNYETSAALRTVEIFNRQVNLKGLSKLLFLLNLFEYKRPFENLSTALNNELTRHCNNYMEDITYLAQTLNISITRNDK